MTDTVTLETIAYETLPTGWIQARVGDLLEAINGRGFKKSEWQREGLPIIRIQNLKASDASFNFFQGELDNKHRVRPGDLLFAWSGTPGTSFGAFVWNGPEGALNQHIFRLEFDKSLIHTRYLSYILNEQVAKFIEQAQGGVGLAHITKSKFIESRIPLAPLNEQRRIVEKIEELFTKLDAGVSSLEQVREQLKSYRRSVLKAAVEGELSREWREAYRDELEPASELLDRILKERREKFAGKKYKEPAAPDTLGLPELPKRWEWATGSQLAAKIVDGTHHTPTYVQEGIAFISVKDIRQGRIHFNDCRYISEEEHQRLKQRCNPETGDVLITKSGTIGRTAVVDTDNEFSLFVSVALLKRASHELNSRFLKLSLEAYIQSIDIQQVVKGGVIKNLHLEDLRIVPLRLAPTEEQEVIIQEVERRLSVVDKLEATVEANLKQAAGLRQSILKQAFSGELVPQDPEDEPAGVLLARIREEGEAAKQKARKPRKFREDDEAQGRLM